MIERRIDRRQLLTATLGGGAGALLFRGMDSAEVSDRHDLEALRSPPSVSEDLIRRETVPIKTLHEHMHRKTVT
jgi:hypothetical protein